MSAPVLLAVMLARAPTPTSGETATYADTCVEHESDDTVGTLITISDRGTHPRVSVSWSEGSMMAPIAGRATFDAATGSFRFAIPTDGGSVSFQGRRGRALTGQFRLPWETSPRPVVLAIRTAGTPPGPCAEG